MLTDRYKNIHLEEIKRHIRRRFNKYIEALYSGLFASTICLGFGSTMLIFPTNGSWLFGLVLILVGVAFLYCCVVIINSLRKKGLRSAIPTPLDLLLISVALVSFVFFERFIEHPVLLIVGIDILVSVNHARRLKGDYRIWFFGHARAYIEEIRSIKGGYQP